MGTTAAVLRLVIQRAFGHWRLLLTLAVGMLISSALMASVFIYTDAVRDLGLRHALRSESPRALQLEVTTDVPSTTVRDYSLAQKTTDDLIAAYGGDVFGRSVHFGQSATFFPTAAGDKPALADPQRPRANLQYGQDLASHVTLKEGSPPAPGTEPPQVWMEAEAAARAGLRPGQRFDLHPHWRDGYPPLTVELVGTFTVNNPAELYWGTARDRFDTPTSWLTYRFFLVNAETYLRTIDAYLPDTDSVFETLAPVDRGAVNSANARQVEQRVAALESELRAKILGTRSTTSLPEVLESYREKLFFTRLPLFALVLQVVAIALFYLVMVSSMLVERQAGEIALFKSRGASTGQVMGIYALEGGLLTILATVAGPLLAAAAIALLGYAPAFANLSGDSLLDVRLSPGAFLLAGGGAVLALVALLIPAFRASRQSIVHFKQSVGRPQRQPVFLRYYLDLAVIAVAAFAFYQVRERGTLVTDRLFGDLAVDPLLLATPLLFMVMVALVFLRLFPLALRVASWAARGLRGPTLNLGLTRMVRSPLQQSRLILLLILTTAVGMFAAGFRATLDRGNEDRAAYEAGAPLRLEGARASRSPGTAGLTRQAVRVVGADEAVPIARIDGSYSVGLGRSISMTLLAVPPELADVAHWRSDYGASSMAALLDRLDAERRPEVAAPPVLATDARALGVWVRHPLAPNLLRLSARVRDAEGVLYEFSMAPVQEAPGGWRLYAADLGRPLQAGRTDPPPSRPLTFDALAFSTVGVQPLVPEPTTVYFDDLQTATSWPPVLEASGFIGRTVADPFDDAKGFEIISGTLPSGDFGALSLSANAGRDGSGAVRLDFVRKRGATSIFGLRRTRPAAALPVLVDRGFLSAANLDQGDTITVNLNRQYVSVRIAGTFKLFPGGYDPESTQHLFVADYATATGSLEGVPIVSGALIANELWLSDRGSAPTTIKGFSDAGLDVSKIHDEATLLAEQSSDPLVAASWEGILFLCFGVVLLLSALGFTTTAVVAARTRSVEFAILRTLGFARRQIVAVIAFENAFVITAGVVVGTLLGFPLNRFMVAYLGFTERGRDPLPPLVSEVSWQAIFTVYALLAVVIALTLTALLTLYSRLAVSRALRIGEL